MNNRVTGFLLIIFGVIFFAVALFFILTSNSTNDTSTDMTKTVNPSPQVQNAPPAAVQTSPISNEPSASGNSGSLFDPIINFFSSVFSSDSPKATFQLPGSLLPNTNFFGIQDSSTTCVGGLINITSNTIINSSISCDNIVISNSSSLRVNGSNIIINATTLTINAGSSINSTSLGCTLSQSPNTTSGGCSNFGSVAGYGEGQDSTFAGGAGHGGAGGNSGGSAQGGFTYDDPLLPILPGSGGGNSGGGPGGGAVRITAQTLNLNGNIFADGMDGSGNGGSGSGGSILIEANSITGTGILSAKGGVPGAASSGGGGGGRIAVYYNTSTWSPLNRVNVSKGINNYVNYLGQDGTAIIVDLDDNNAFISGGFEFNNTDFYSAGTFKTTSGAMFKFNNLTILSSTLRLDLFANITANTLNLTNARSINCDNVSRGILFTENTAALRDSTKYYINYTSAITGSLLNFTNCTKIIFDEPTQQITNTNNLLSDNDFGIFTSTLTLNNISTSGNLIINGTTATLAGTIGGFYTLINETNLTINSAGGINSTTLGCPVSQSPNTTSGGCSNYGSNAGYGEGGDGTYGGGAGHGGAGSASAGSSPGGNAYDDPLLPILPGSGAGGNGGGYGGPGGGAVRITAQTLNLNGNIFASGMDGSGNGGGGSGGSILIEANSITGTGNLNAKGGPASSATSGAGGGGRIAVYYNTSTWSPLNRVNVSKGINNYVNYLGQDGTAIIVDLDDNNAFISGGFEFNNTDFYSAGTFKTTSGAMFKFNNLTILSGTLRLDLFANITANTLNLTNAGSINCDNGTTGILFNANAATLRDSTKYYINYTSAITGSLLNFTNCTRIIFDEPAQQITNTNKIISDSNLDIFGSTLIINNISSSTKLLVNATILTIDAGSSINLTGLGCPTSQSPNTTSGGCSDFGTAAGYGEGTDGTYPGGGGHGGAGAVSAGSSPGGKTYDDPLLPILPGSGGGNSGSGAGGGAIRIIAQTLNLNGNLFADGAKGTGNGAGGSGGSILIETNSMTGTGNLNAKGGPAVGGNPVSGGGGRIAVYYNTSTWSPLNKVNISAGTSGFTVGQDGTVIVIDVGNNICYALQTTEFNTTSSYAPGNFKTTTGSIYNFNALNALGNPTIRYTGSNPIINASLLNLTGANSTVPGGARLILQYSDVSSNLGNGYSNSSAGTFFLTVDRNALAKIDWIPGFSNITSLGASVNISQNSIYINSTKAKALNVSANITIRGLGFAGDYNITREEEDGSQSPCTSPVCNKISYSGGIAVFNVSKFTRYFTVGQTAFLAPTDNTVLSNFIFNASSLGTITNGTSSDTPQTISIVQTSTGKKKVEFTANFGSAAVDLSSITLAADASRTVVNMSSASGISLTHTLYVPDTLHKGVFVCPNAVSLNQVSLTCSGSVGWSYAQMGTIKTVGTDQVNVSTDGINYKISGLSGSGAGEGSSTILTIWDETDAGMPFGNQTKNTTDQLTFFANFTNSSNGPANTTNGGCKIDFEFPVSYSGYQNMAFNTTYNLYTYSSIFNVSGTYNWKVNCTGQGDIVSATDTFTITSPFVAPGAVPEFSTIALIAAITLAIASVFFIRSRQN